MSNLPIARYNCQQTLLHQQPKCTLDGGFFLFQPSVLLATTLGNLSIIDLRFSYFLAAFIGFFASALHSLEMQLSVRTQGKTVSHVVCMTK
jgi:hypothetical protein